MFQLKNVTRQFGRKIAVEAVTFDIPQGQMVGIIGRSGAGKSTLLRMINRLNDVSSGSIHFGDLEVSSLRGAALRNWQRDCAMIFQQFNLVPRLDVLTNVMLGRLNHRSTLSSLFGLFTQDERLAALAALERLGIEQTAMQPAGTLSGGQQQRVAIARALMQQPKMLLADEPIASLDPLNAKIVMDALRDINEREGITVVTNLHTLDTAPFLLRAHHRHGAWARRVRWTAARTDGGSCRRNLRQRRGNRGIDDIDQHQSSAVARQSEGNPSFTGGTCGPLRVRPGIVGPRQGQSISEANSGQAGNQETISC